NAAKRLITSRINVMRIVYKIKPDSSGSRPAMTTKVDCNDSDKSCPDLIRASTTLPVDHSMLKTDWL
ncbi:MAG: hypothetical protein VCD66_02620, partial [Alphaproteobacteria bacterium]